MMKDKVRATGGLVESPTGSTIQNKADRLGTAKGCPGGFLRFNRKEDKI